VVDWVEAGVVAVVRVEKRKNVHAFEVFERAF
jgi:hypothetical protein